MPAYIIVEIEILDPVGYEEYKKLAGARNTSSAAAKPKCWKAIGNRSASLCFNLNQPSAPKSGSTAKNIASRVGCATARQKQT